jgi:hypothetical protein
MDRRTFLTTMLQGSFAAALFPNGISPLLITQYASLHHPVADLLQDMHISAIGIGTFGAYCTRLLAYSVQNIRCHEVASHPQGYHAPELSGLASSLLQCDLLFLLTDTTQPWCSHQLTTCIEAATTAGVQTVVIGPHAPDVQGQRTTTLSPLPYCIAADPLTAHNLVALVADLANTDSFVGIDHGDVKAILKSGRHGTVVSNEVSGPDRAASAAAVVLEQLQNQGFGPANCCGAMACIYGSPSMPFDDYHQAITMLDRYFSPDISFIFGSVVDEKLNGSIRLVILATR